MRRKEKEIGDRAEIDAIIRRCQVCRLGLSDHGTPYVVPLCFGYDGQALFFHCAREGRKLEILKQNGRVCVEFDIVEGVEENLQGCDWDIRYQCVLAAGRASLVEGAADKERALALIMDHYAPRQTFSFPPEAVRRAAVVKIDIENLTGKQSKRLAGQ